MHEVVLDHAADFAGWRAAARSLLAAGVAPEHTAWSSADDQAGLFAGSVSLPEPSGPAPTVPKAFMDLARKLVCHSDPERFALAYRLAWRITHGERRLMENAVDADVHRARGLEKAVQRDRHKMKAFVRFREVATDEGEHFIAWFEPDHHIVEFTAPFFARRFTAMRWSILTPKRCVHWDGQDLRFTPGASRADAPAGDALEDYWRTYFANIFNPARLKVKAMTAEMPRKYWKNLPEAVLIKPLIDDAQARARAMVAAAPTAPARKGRAVYTRAQEAPMTTLDALAKEAAGCIACPLYKDATQVVFGEGPADARLMIVGEQPGDREDLEGRPFVGPAGQLMDRIMDQAGLDRSAAYVTNAVKHFKFTPRGKRRIHAKPTATEVVACNTWLVREIDIVKPSLVVCLGTTAARAVLGPGHTIKDLRGRVLTRDDGLNVLATVHPSYLLRLPDADARTREEAAFFKDLKLAAAFLSAA